MYHALSGELIDIRPFGSAITSTRTATLYKTKPAAIPAVCAWE